MDVLLGFVQSGIMETATAHRADAQIRPVLHGRSYRLRLDRLRRASPRFPPSPNGMLG